MGGWGEEVGWGGEVWGYIHGGGGGGGVWGVERWGRRAIGVAGRGRG